MGVPLVEAVNPEDLERYEMIDGVVYDMFPSPTEGHQRATTAIGSLFFSALKGRCRTYVSPFDVWPTGDTKDAYVQPDVSVICDSSKITNDGCVGAYAFGEDEFVPARITDGPQISLEDIFG